MLRFGELPTSKPLRQWLAASGADQIVVDPTGGWNEPTGRAAVIIRADPTECASGWAARLEGLGGEQRPAPHAWLAAEAAALVAIDAELGGVGGIGATGPMVDPGPLPGATGPANPAPEVNEPSLHLALGRAHADGDLVYTASSMPIRDQETFLGPGEADVLLLCNRGANGIDGLVSSGIGAAHASGRPTTIVTGDLGLLHDIGGLAALRDVSTPVRIVVIDNGGGGIFHFLPQQQALEAEEFEALLGTPRGVSVERAAALFDLPYRRLESLAELPDALAAGTGLIEVRTDRQTNVAAHRRVTERVLAALSSELLVAVDDSGQHRPELDLGLGQLGLGVGAGDDADAGEEVGVAVAQEGAAQGDAEFAVLGGVHPADRGGVPAAVELLQLGQRPRRPRARARRRPRGSGGASRPARSPSAARPAGRSPASPGAGCWRP